MADQVRFRRIRGRIVPIRGGGAAPAQDKEWSGLRTWSTGFGLNMGGNVLGQKVATPMFRRPTDPTLESLTRKYASELRAAKANVAHVDGQKAPVSKITSRGFLGLAKGRHIIGDRRMSEAAFLHELGHLQASAKKGTANRVMRKAHTWASRGSMPQQIRKSMIVSTAYQAGGSLIPEAEATAFAMKTAYKRGGARAAARVLPKNLVGYSTYALVAAGTIMQNVGIYRGIRNTFFRKGEKKK